MLLSARHLTNDHFWFTFFHEAAHLLLHNKEDALCLEGHDRSQIYEEQEANDFAAKILIPPASLPSLLALRATTHEVARFATRIGVPPGVVVGQLQYRGTVGYHQLNGLKRRFKWVGQPPVKLGIA